MSVYAALMLIRYKALGLLFMLLVAINLYGIMNAIKDKQTEELSISTMLVS